jgi:hypothetical protein
MRVKIAVALERSPPLFIRRTTGLALNFYPIALLAGAIRRIASLRHDGFDFHAIGRLQQLDPIIEGPLPVLRTPTTPVLTMLR